jgi:hypothetical protein
VSTIAVNIVIGAKIRRRPVMAFSIKIAPP